MTRTDEVKKGGDDGEITVNAVPADSSGAPFVMASPPTYNNGAAPGEPPIPYGHRRFYCSTCRTPYDLPDQTTSWRCANCHTFNSITPGECPCCTIL